MQPAKQENSNQTLFNLSSSGLAKGLSGDALWNDVVASAGKYTSTSAFGCFAAGTLVHTDKGLVPIQNIKVGDRVLAKPESGEGEVSYKPVLKTFEHKDKELWLVVAEKHWSSEGVNDIWVHPRELQLIPSQSELIATPNHPVWVVGMAVLDSDQHVESIVNYPQPHWKRVDQLQQLEVIVNKEGILFIIERAQPVYHFKNDYVDNKSSYFWFQDNYNESIKFKSLEQFNDSEESKEYTDYQEYLAHEFKQLETGWVRDISHYYETGRTGRNIKSHNGLGVAWHRNALKNNEGLYVPFTDTVYNLEVAEDHTYFVTRAGIWVHNTNCDKAREMLVGALEGDFTKIYTSKNSFSDDITKALNEGKSIEEIRQVTFTHGATIAPDQIGLTGDALWNDVVASAGKYTSTSAFGCFAAGTLVHTEQGLVPIQDIKVGDRVLAKPESGDGEVSYKPVLKTFEHKDKELWLVVAEKHWSDEDIHGKLIDSTTYRRADEKAEFIATPNHPVWVVGMGKMGQGNLDEIIVYPQPHWKRVDQLQQYEVVVNKDGILFIIERAQPVYHFQNENVENKISHMWYQHHCYYDTYISPHEFEDSEISKDFADYQDYLQYRIHQDKKGRVVDIEHYYATNRTGLSVKDINGNPFLENFAQYNKYVPFTDTVYNLEVAEDHTYFVTEAGIWVHNTDCNKAREMLVGKLEGDFAKIKTSKESFSKDITKALNEGKSIEEIRQVALTHGETIAPDQIGLTGDALWNDVVASAGKYTSTSAFGCFAAGTLVHTEQGLVPIQDIKVGDRVLAKPESGDGEVSYKPVLKTFEHKDKELWLVETEKHFDNKDINGKRINSKLYHETAWKSEFIATPNHPVWVVGMGVWDGRQSLEEIIAYPQPHWKRIDQLQQYEVVVNKEGILFYIKQAQPLFLIEKSSPPPYHSDHDKHLQLNTTCAWYQNHYYITEDYEDYEDYDLDRGYVLDMINYYGTNSTGLYVNNLHGGIEHYLPKNEKHNPFTDTVYNLEVAEDHTYFVTEAGIWVHNTNCDKAREMLVGALEGDFTKIYTSKNSFSNDITKALNEGKSIEEIRQVTFTHGATIAPDQIGLTGDALWNDVVASAGKYTSTSAFGCFAAGTLVHTEQGLVPIQDIKVGDRVLAKPESGDGEVSYKPVLKTFEHKDKELWLVSVEKHSRNKDIKGNRLDRNMFYETVDSSQFIATPNHPVWVVGIGKMGQGILEELIAYPQPHWKRVDQLQQYEVVVNKDGILFYIRQAQPLHYIKTSCAPEIQANHNIHLELKENCAWYQRNYYLAEGDEDYDLLSGRVINLEHYYATNRTGLHIENINGNAIQYNLSKDSHGQYLPFADTVYNLEVAEDHTYFVTEAGIWVHNTNCDKAREMLVGALEGDFAKIYTSKQNFSKAITKALNEGKSIEEIRQVALTYGETIAPDQIGLTGDALWKNVVASAGKYTSTAAFGCFAAGTKVQTERGRIPIQDVQVGDLVLSKPENGDGEITYKPVLNTFAYENKPLWLVKLKKHWSDEDINGNIIDSNVFRNTLDRGEFLVTPNHPIMVLGMGTWDGRTSLENISAYTKPEWKRIDQLQQYEMVVNRNGILFYVEQAQPLYQFINQDLTKVDPTLAWYQQHYYISKDPDITEDIEYYDFNSGFAIDIDVFKNEQSLAGSKLSEKLGVGFFKSNELFDLHGDYVPFTDTVYNLEVADNHTYFVTMSGIFVHNTSSPEQTLWQTTLPIRCAPLAAASSHKVTPLHGSTASMQAHNKLT